MCYSNMCPNCEQQSNEIEQFRIYHLPTYLAKLELVSKLFLDAIIKQRLLQFPAVVMQLWHGTFQHQLVKRLS